MTCSVPSHHFKVFFPVRKKTVWLYTVFWIMKKLEAVRNRAPASTFLFDTLIRVLAYLDMMEKIIVFILQTAL